MANMYVSSTRYTSVAQWATNHVYAAGAIVRQLAAPAVGSERCFQTALGGTSNLTTEPIWVLTAGGVSPTDGTITDWTEITGQAAKNGDGGGTNWAAPHARVLAATANGWASGSNDFVYTANDSAETSATPITIVSNTSMSAPVRIISIDPTVIPSTAASVSAGAIIASTTNATITINGAFYIKGFTINAGSAGSAANVGICSGTGGTQGAYFEDCNLTLNNTNVGSVFGLGAGASSSVKDTYGLFLNCTFKFGATAQQFSYRFGNWAFINCTISNAGSSPTVLMKGVASTCGSFLMQDCDLSKVTGTLADVSIATNYAINIQNTKIANAVTMTTGSIVSPGAISFRLDNSDSSATSYRKFYQNYCGTFQQSTAIFRSGGATDLVTPISYQIVTTANAQYFNPFIADSVSQYNTVSGAAITAKLYLTCASALDSSKVWVRWEYLGSNATPQGTTDLTSRTTNILTAGVALTTDSTSTWTGGLGNNYVISTTFTPQMAGYIIAYVQVANASLTLNFDPRITIQDASGNVKSCGRSMLLPGYGYATETAPSFFDIGLTGGIEG